LAGFRHHHPQVGALKHLARLLHPHLAEHPRVIYSSRIHKQNGTQRQ
jgi:hypothetical protein